MKVIQLTTTKQLKKFVNMPDKIYSGDKFYVPYMRGDLLKTLTKLVLKDKSYTALAVEKDGKYVARVLFTTGPSKQLKLENCGYFSHFECIDDNRCANALLSEMCRILKERGVTHVEGTYFPYDQDNRRGILVEGFEYEPMILTSYNLPYYGRLLEQFGLKKDFDTVSYHIDYDRYEFTRIDPIVKKILARYDLYIAPADFKNIEREIDDVHEVIEQATSEVIFQEAPTREDLTRIVANWKSFLWADLIHICRRRSDNKPVGIMMSVPNFFTVFRKMKGKTNPVALIKALHYRKKIKSVRAILQYVIPKYQGCGVNFALYHEFYLACKKRGVTYMEGGTIMEDNEISRRNVEKAGGKLNKIFRLYGKDI